MNKRSFKSDTPRGILAKNVVAAVLCCAVWLGAVASCPAEEKRQLSPDELQAALLELSGGASVKLVWQQDENAIVTFDTKGATKRTLYSGPVGERSWPIITRDGSNPLFPALRSGHRLFQRPSRQKQIPSSATPFSPPSGLATGSFNGLHAKSKFLAAK